MSVLACNRRGCTNIMCERLSSQYGYICDTCFEELVSSGITIISKFMDTTPEEVDKAATHNYYNTVFPKHH